jgi:hypothetical protein
MIINGGTLDGGVYQDTRRYITNGLKLYLDSANPSSYPGSGTTWYDLSGEGYQATIQTGMTYVGAGFGYDYGAGLTVNVWAKFTTPVDGESQAWERLVDFGNGAGINNIILARRDLYNNVLMDIEAVNSDYMDPSEPTINWDQWAMYTMLADGTYWKMYKNGVFQCFEINSLLPYIVTRNLNYIGKSNWEADANYLGAMSVIQLYNRALTEPELAQTFDYFKGRYGL